MNLNRFFAIARLREEELYDSLFEFLFELYPRVIKNMEKTYLYAQGQSSVCLVAHLDTVFQNPPTKLFHSKINKNIIQSPKQGLGADDRAGVYAIVTLLLDGLRPSVIFTTGEECGAIGAFDLITDHDKCPVNANCLIALDRQGKKDSIYYNCGNQEFKSFIDSFGFRATEGIFSDICVLAPFWDIAAVNLSVGFANEHTLHERLNTQFLDLTISKVNDIILSEPKFYDFQEGEDITFWRACFTCTSGNCEDCPRLKEFISKGGFHAS